MPSLPTPEFLPVLPNVFSVADPLSERELQELQALRQSPTLRKVLTMTLQQEYGHFLGRSPLKQAPADLTIQHAYLAGMYALAASLLAPPAPKP